MRCLLAPHVWGFKVNDQLDVQGVECLSTIKNTGDNTGAMSDPKIHDTTYTNGNRARRHAKAGADLVTVHASSGESAFHAAVEKAHEANPNCKILCMTVPTSMSEEECLEVYGTPRKETMIRLGKIGARAGAWGMICGPPDLAFLKEVPELKDLNFVCPGIRDKDSPPDDQLHKGTPAEAAAWGAALQVIGRLITNDKDPLAKTKAINAQIEAALKVN